MKSKCRVVKDDPKIAEQRLYFPAAVGKSQYEDPHVQQAWKSFPDLPGLLACRELLSLKSVDSLLKSSVSLDFHEKLAIAAADVHFRKDFPKSTVRGYSHGSRTVDLEIF